MIQKAGLHGPESDLPHERGIREMLPELMEISDCPARPNDHAGDGLLAKAVAHLDR